MENAQRMKGMTRAELLKEVDALSDERLEALDAALGAVLDEDADPSALQTQADFAGRTDELMRLLKVAFAVKTQRHLREILRDVEQRHTVIVTYLDGEVDRLTKAVADKSTTNAGALTEAQQHVTELQGQLLTAREELQKAQEAATAAATSRAPAGEVERLQEENERLQRQLSQLKQSMERTDQFGDAEIAKVRGELKELFAHRKATSASGSGGLGAFMPGFFTKAG